MSHDSKEPFCGACLAIPLALAGVGTAGVGAAEKGGHKKRKKILLISGIALTLLSAAIAIYFIFIRKCKSCNN
jgi:flagellar basal body-associated protein FliL